VEFRHPTSLWKKGTDPDNAGGYYSYMDQSHYVNGIAAGLSTKTGAARSRLPLSSAILSAASVELA
jgi:hypothetical protein